ncbi:LysR family transcriptional regulator [Bdellovibrio sp. HCB337]|uniref:LysR family transcriptional regulator n=1 Tax=Bdellovibrio sp. HCB337 TaxID=3394358 RepID=UPI0039A413C5
MGKISQDKRVKLNQLDLNEIHYFVRVVQEGSLSAASRFLQIPKSKISRKLTSFEKKVGHVLLKRNTRSVVLTEEGQKIYNLVGGHLSEMISELDNNLSPQSELSGQLKIAVPSGLGMGPMMTIVGQFRKKFPGVKIHIQFTDKTLPLLKQDFDLAINVGPVRQETLIAVTLAEMDMLFFASPEYLKRNGTPLDVEDLKNHFLIELNNNDEAEIVWPLTSSKNETKEIAIRSALSVNLPQTLKLALLDHQGIGILPWVVANPESKEGSLVQVLPEWRVKNVPLYFVYPKLKVKNQKVKSFVSFFKNEIARLKPDEC